MSIQYYWSKLLKKLRGAAVSNSCIESSSKIEAGTQFVHSTMGRHSFCGYDCEIVNTDIGHFCSIANYVVIGGGQHPIDWVGTSPVFYEGRDSVKKKFSSFSRPLHKRVAIGSDVWIGHRAIVMQGVTIGHGAVIGAGAVVTKDVTPYSIVAGIPARHIRYRFEDTVRHELLAGCWWELDDVNLEKCAYEIRNPRRFIEVVSRCE